jgi:hypothetical protein
LGFRTTTTLTQLAANSTISQPNVTGGTFDTITRLGVGVAANTSYGIINRYFGNSEIATQYGTGLIAGVGAYATNGGLFIDNGTTKTYPLLVNGSGIVFANSGFGSTGTAYFCRAWVNFNGTGTVAIRSSGNVSSITDSGTGNYTVNFTTAMPDANYAVFGNTTRDGYSNGTPARFCTPHTLATGSVVIPTFALNTDALVAVEDLQFISVTIVR